MKYFGFKKTLILTLVSLISGCFLLLSLIFYNILSENVNNSVKKEINLVAELEAKKVNEWLNKKVHSIKAFNDYYRSGLLKNDYVDLAMETKKTNELFSVYISFDDGRSYSTAVGDSWENGVADIDKYDARTRPWYKLGKSKNDVIFTDVYEDITTGKKVVSILKNLGDGVVSEDVDLSILDRKIQTVDFPGSVIAILDNEGRAIASDSKQLTIGASLQDLGLNDLHNKVLLEHDIDYEYELEGIEKVAIIKPITLSDGKYWYLFIALDKSLAYSNLVKARNETIISSVSMLVVASLLAVLVLHFLYRPILALKTTIQNLSSGNGDLTQRLTVKADDDLGQIAKGVNTFIQSLQSMMLEIEAFTIKLQGDVKALSVQTQMNGQILAKHVVETEQIVTAIEEMNSTAESVAHHAAETAQFTSEATKISSESLDVVNDAQLSVSSLVREVEDTSHKIQIMSEETKDIGTILDVIGNIAEQTNLLALNAAIEAARAGEQGRGFAVVADEVRALASRTQTSTSEVEKALDSLVNGSKMVANSMGATKETCHTTSKNTELVGQRINGLSNHISEINDLGIQISTAAEEQSCVTQEVSRNMASISDMVSQLSTNGQETTQKTENIAMINTQIIQIVNQFKLK